MSNAVSSALASVLKARRAEFNQRFLAAQQQHRTLTADAWQSFLRETLSPVGEIVAAHDAAAVDGVINVLYEQALPLVAKQWLGPAPRDAVFAACYKQLLAALAPLLAREPERVSGALLNALHQMCALDGVYAKEWTQRMVAILKPVAGSTTVDQALALGRVVAWRAGMASQRDAALRDGPTLPVEWTRAALDVPFTPDTALWNTLAQNPALRAEEKAPPAKPEWLGWCGGFRGLGGPFAFLPVLGMAGGRLAASDGQHTWWLAADGYGRQCVRVGAASEWPLQPGDKQIAAKVGEGGFVVLAGRTHPFPELETARDAVWHHGILAVVLRTSYQVALLRCPRLT
jgi:hypothetical protein